MSEEYKKSVFLPNTSFPMRANLPEKEPALLKRWQEMGLYQRLRALKSGRKPFILHDGPPYANGNLHLGHALNKILKDVVIKSHQMLGFDAPFVPGWDCHGLPIEAKVEENYRKQGMNKDEVPVLQFRQECRDYARKWVDIQKAEFQRLGISGRWNKPYTTMDYKAEAQIVRELGKFVDTGAFYLGTKPIMWSVVEKTALAEAEIEYHDRTSRAIYLGFTVASSPRKELEGAMVVIWTTTPWTIPANRAIAFGASIEYVLIDAPELPCPVLVAKDLLTLFAVKAGLTAPKILHRYQGHQLTDVVCHHPLYSKGYDFDVPLLPGEHVTTDTGSGFVHTAPGHGVEDFALGKEFGLEVPYTVNDDGTYADHIPLFAGTHIFKADEHVMPVLRESGCVLAEESITHSYPHSWRSKAPLIYRTTPQWFISMDVTSLRTKALQSIDEVTWHPKISKNRIRAMVEGRPDWCVSRQRTWGVPITLFLHKKTRQPLRDAALFERIAKAVEHEGADVWFTHPEQRFLPPHYNPDEYEAVKDILDVWFDAGSTHAFVLEEDEELAWPATLYLEGSDQHRGWFQSSLLISCGTRGKAPFQQVLTHGFLLDEHGQKLSKSKGNFDSLETILNTYGADILRLWVVSSDYTQDLKFGANILKQQEDIYRRFRNTLRYLLGSLEGFEDKHQVPYDALPELEKWALHNLYALDQKLRVYHQVFDYHALIAELHSFCSNELSAFYFDIRKDTLYCDSKHSHKRRAALTVLDHLFNVLVRWLAPVLCFTAEEAWLARLTDQKKSIENVSIHLEEFLSLPKAWYAPALAEKIDKTRLMRRVLTGALETARTQGVIGASLQAAIDVYAPSEMLASLTDVDWAELTISSQVTLHRDMEPLSACFTLEDIPHVGAVVTRASGMKCQRCWKVLPEVGIKHPDLCQRCANVLDENNQGATCA